MIRRAARIVAPVAPSAIVRPATRPLRRMRIVPALPESGRFAAASIAARGCDWARACPGLTPREACRDNRACFRARNEQGWEGSRWMGTPKYPEHAVADARAQAVLDRLRAADQAQRDAGLPQSRRTRNITAPTGSFLYATVRATGARRIFEMGSSNGYSTIWLALAARELGGWVVGSEILPERVEAANRNLAEAGLAEVAEVR